jgi:hypothetical protein
MGSVESNMLAYIKRRVGWPQFYTTKRVCGVSSIPKRSDF